jgi:hypothetical protein
VKNRTSLFDEWRWFAVWRGIEEAKQSQFSRNLFFRIRQSSGELGSGLVYPERLSAAACRNLLPEMRCWNVTESKYTAPLVCWRFSQLVVRRR